MAKGSSTALWAGDLAGGLFRPVPMPRPGGCAGRDRLLRRPVLLAEVVAWDANRTPSVGFGVCLTLGAAWWPHAATMFDQEPEKADDRLTSDDGDLAPQNRHLSARDVAIALIIATVIVAVTIHFVRLG